MSAGEVSGYVATVLVFMTFYMKTMVPLRLIGLCSNCAFITYGFIGGLYPVLILHAILLPLNSLRLREMLQLTKQVRAAAHGDSNTDWLKPFTSTRHVKVPQGGRRDFGREKREFAGGLRPDRTLPRRRKHQAGSTAQRAANEDDPDFYPLWVIYGGHCPGGYLLARVFPASVHL